jgi:hypothetical protein
MILLRVVHRHEQMLRGGGGRGDRDRADEREQGRGASR